MKNFFKIKERPDVGVYVKDLSTVTVSSADELEKIMGLGNKNSNLYLPIDNDLKTY